MVELAGTLPLVLGMEVEFELSVPVTGGGVFGNLFFVTVQRTTTVSVFGLDLTCLGG
jgi:hypothetical protein